MIRKAIALSFVLLATSGCCSDDFSFEQIMAARHGGSMKMQVCVIDDTGKPVADAQVKCSMSAPRSGWNHSNAVTGTNGVCSVGGRTDGEEIRLSVNKDGYYGSSRKYCFVSMDRVRDVRFNRWQPYGEEITITLYPIRNPAKVVVSPRRISPPRTDTWLGFDMEKKDWVSPYGTGTNEDLRIRLKWDGLPSWESRSMEVDVEIPGTDDGMYLEEKLVGSKLTSPYRALPDQDFNGQKSFHYFRYRRDDIGYYKSNVFCGKDSMVVRMRTKRDSQGKIVSCHYGRIECIELNAGGENGFSLYLRYIFNPTPNDTNLEYVQR